MIEKQFEKQIREYLSAQWGMDMSLYDAKVMVDNDQTFNIQVLFTHKKTGATIFLNEINYMITNDSYRIGIIQLLDKEPLKQKSFF